MQKRTFPSITPTLFLSFFLPFSLFQTACLPSSQRQNTHELTPGDSLSREIAAAAPVDSLQLVSVIYGTEESPMELPTSLVWLPDSLGGKMYVVDTRRGSLHVIGRDAGYEEEWQPEGLEYPYVAGVRGDTLVLLNRGHNRLDFIWEAEIIRSVLLREEEISSALVTDSAIFVKRSDENAIRLLRVSESGETQASYELPGPYWRHIGFLRAWGDSLLSLSGFRPVVDVLSMDAPDGTISNSMALVGFDSPQLVRSNQYMLGEVDQPPLLVSSVAPFGDNLYVLNIRADGIRIDVYGREGRIERALVYLDVEALPNAFPVDIAVRQDGAGLLFALVMQNPGGLLNDPSGYILMLRWDRPSA
ncbi:MAG: hypothetical protein IIC18_04325 [Bacteroidetes bacterium]|nr:hypothetical protein [Bacteroidota bacterium]